MQKAFEQRKMTAEEYDTLLSLVPLTPTTLKNLSKYGYV
jgi:hypothetical protein